MVDSTAHLQGTRSHRLVVGGLVVLALAALFVLRVCWGADRSAATLDDGFEALATALSTPAGEPRRDAAFAAATEAFADASGSAIGASLSILSLEMTVRLRGTDRSGLADPLPAVFKALEAADPKSARAVLLAWRDNAPSDRERDTYVLLQEFVQRLVEKMSR